MTTITKPPEPVPPTPIERVHIVATPGTCGGKPRIAGTRIPVKHVAIMVEQERMTPADIIEGYPHLTLAGIHAALAYYYDHKEELDREIQEESEWYERMLAEQPPLPMPTGRRSSTNVADDPLPSR